LGHGSKTPIQGLLNVLISRLLWLLHSLWQNIYE